MQKDSNVSKGHADEFLQLKHSIRKSETMIFGDYYYAFGISAVINDYLDTRYAEIFYISDLSPRGTPSFF